MNKLKAMHLAQLRKMFMDENTSFDASEIRGTDLPTEYVAILGFLFIGIVGGFVAISVKKAQSTLPIDSVKRND